MLRYLVTGPVLIVLQDIDYYNSLKWIKENSVEGLDMQFTVEEQVLGQTVERNLKPNGDKIDVTDQNKNEYVE